MFSLASAAFSSGTVISSSAVNADLSDIATNGLSKAVATIGGSVMTGQFLAASGSVGSPGITFGSDTKTGFYLSGTHQIGVTTNGIQAATFNSDQSVTYNGAATITGATTLTGNVTLNATSYTFGAGAATGFWTGIAAQVSVAIVIDGFGAVIGTGQKGQLRIPFNATITRWDVMADQSGSVVIDILRANNAIPSVSMVGAGNKPTLTASQFTGAAVSGWTSTALSAADFIAFNVTSATTVTRVSVNLLCTRIGS